MKNRNNNVQRQGYHRRVAKNRFIHQFIFFFLNQQKLKHQDITLFTRQMASLVTAGIPLVQSFDVVIRSRPHCPLSTLVQKIKSDVESGLPFSTALKKQMKKQSHVFDELYCNLIAIGEQSGTLDTMLDRIATYREKMDSLFRRVKKSLVYPTAVIMIAAIITWVLLVKVVPTFKEMFEGLGAELPAFTRFVIHFSEYLQNQAGYILGIIFAIFYILCHCYHKKMSFRNGIQSLSLRIPLFGQIIQKACIARFARTLATTIQSGVPITEALGTIARASGNIVFTKIILKIKEGVIEGHSLSMILKNTQENRSSRKIRSAWEIRNADEPPNTNTRDNRMTRGTRSARKDKHEKTTSFSLFLPMVIQMITIGEETGALEQMLSKIASLYEEEVDILVDGLTTLLEPIIMIVLGVLVGGLSIAMYLPIFQMGELF